MSNQEKTFVSKDELAELLCIDVEDVEKMVQDKSVPYSLLPTGQHIFHRPTIVEWALSLNQTSIGPAIAAPSEPISEDPGQNPFIEKILMRFRYSHKTTKSGYINLYKGQKVFAQFHPSKTGGVDLALGECGDDSHLPKVRVLKRFHELWKLHGFVRNNKPWLEGTRISNSPAAAFNVPARLKEDEDHPGWSELEELLTYSFNHR